jgi:hypothetical protein
MVMIALIRSANSALTATNRTAAQVLEVLLCLNKITGILEMLPGNGSTSLPLGRAATR